MLVMGLGIGCHTNNSKFEDLTTDSIAITKPVSYTHLPKRRIYRQAREILQKMVCERS